MRPVVAVFLFLAAACVSAPTPQTTLDDGCPSPDTCGQPSGPVWAPPEVCNCICEAGLLCNAGLRSPLPPQPDPSWPVCDPAFRTGCGLTPGGAPAGNVYFAVIGDWGDLCGWPTEPGAQSTCIDEVAAMVDRWDATYDIDFLITTGDNNYPTGDAGNLRKVMRYYQKWAPFAPDEPIVCTPPAKPPRFFPTLGNHDVYTDCGAPYEEYFCQLGLTSSSGKASYYNYAGPDQIVEIFSVNANGTEPDGNTATSKQGQWLQAALGRSQAAWKIVTFHEPPIGTSGTDGYAANMNWPFFEWGASLVLMGHKHVYERLGYGPDQNQYWIINGLGGTTGIAAIQTSQGCTPYPGSLVRFNQSVGAMLGFASKDRLRLCFLAANAANPDGTCVDGFELGTP